MRAKAACSSRSIRTLCTTRQRRMRYLLQFLAPYTRCAVAWLLRDDGPTATFKWSRKACLGAAVRSSYLPFCSPVLRHLAISVGFTRHEQTALDLDFEKAHSTRSKNKKKDRSFNVDETPTRWACVKRSGCAVDSRHLGQLLFRQQCVAESWSWLSEAPSAWKELRCIILLLSVLHGLGFKQEERQSSGIA